MAIKSSSLLIGSTIAATGGTAHTFTEVGETIKNGVKVADFSVTDSRIRPTITCVNRPAVLNSLGKYISKDKKTVRLVIPRLEADGTVSFPLREIRCEDSASMTDAEKLVLNQYAAQIMFDSDFAAFILNGALG